MLQVRYAEGKHFESIQQRANLRYQVSHALSLPERACCARR